MVLAFRVLHVQQRIVLPGCEQLLGMGIRKGVKKHTVDNGKDGCIRADAERQRQHGAQGKPRGAAQSPAGVAHVLQNAFQQTDAARIPALFLYRVGATEV
jgi:hypothetical protein